MKMLHVLKRKEWRAWLAIHHESEKEVWLVFFKRHTGRERLEYDDAVEEAICFGWIDSTIRRLDGERYAQKFTRRSRTSKWSDLNIARAKKMIAARLMTPAGRTRIAPGALRLKRTKSKAQAAGSDAIPPYIRDGLAADKKAWTFFESLAPSYRRLYVRWVDNAKKEETRLRRLAEMLTTLRAGRKLGMK